jgi:hypothetical protein
MERGKMCSQVLECKPILEDFWRSWFRVYPLQGREIFKVYGYDKNGNPQGDRIFLSSFPEFEEFVYWSKAERRPCWLSVQPFSARNSVNTVEKLFFDFDSKDLGLAWKEASQFAETLRKSYGVEPLVCFSGRKGYHVYVFLQEQAKFASVQEAKSFYRTAQTLILKGLNLNTLDMQVIGDIKRVARVPYSVHEKTLELCVPVTQDHKPCWILDLHAFRTRGLNSAFVELCKHKAEEKPRKRVFQASLRKRVKGVRPCLEAALNVDLVETEGHLIRLAIAREYLKNGYSAEQTAKLFQGQRDYNFEVSLGYVRYAQENDCKPFKCSTIRELGFCLENCPRRTRK